jgi:hypothetical protein
MATDKTKETQQADYRANQAPPVDKESASKLWVDLNIDEQLWNAYRPYQLLLVKVEGSGDELSYKPLLPYRFTLPISPQELQIDMPIMTNVQATLGGISETHGGAPFKNIVLTGTTGVLPLRSGAPTGRDSDAHNELLRAATAVFAGTTQAAVRTINSARQTLTGTIKFPNLYEDPVPSGDGSDSTKIPAKSTGYYQYLLLQKFLENYVQIKSKNQYNKSLDAHSRQIRLALAIWKEQSVYLCSGVQLGRRKSATDPHLVTFNLQLKAWARVKLDSAQSPAYFNHHFTARDPNLVAQALARFRNARATIDGLRDVVHSIITDAVSTVGEVMRQTTLFMKSVAGVTHALSDFPDTVKTAALELITKDWNNLRSSFEGVIPKELDEEFRAAQAKGTTSKTTLKDPNLSIIFDTLSPSALRFKPETLRRINDEVAATQKLGRLDFETMRNELRQISDQFAFSVGGGDSTYSATYGTAISSSSRSPTQAEYDALFALNEACQILDALAASGQIDLPTPTSLEYVAGLAEKSGIAFRIPKSKFAVPFPYGMTLERLAARYLGNPNRWHEIATLNGLRAPYVDEVGFSLALLTNGDRNRVVVADASNLYLGQPVWLAADGVMRSRRQVVQIDKVSTNNVVLTLDGDSNLSQFTTVGHAKLEAFLPGTVNSQQVVYIPSENVAGEDPELKAVPGVDAFDPLLQVGGIDLLLTPDGDLAVTPDGDCRLAYGLTNIVQTVKLALATPQGGLLQHPEYGLNIPIGISTADVSPEDLLKSAREYFNNDPTFSGVRSASVQKNGNTVYLAIEVGIAGVNQYIPITVQVNR